MTKKKRIIVRIVVIGAALAFAFSILAFVFFNGNAYAALTPSNDLVIEVSNFGNTNTHTVYHGRLRDLSAGDIRLHTGFSRGTRVSGFSNLSIASGTYTGGHIEAVYGIEEHVFFANVRQSYMIVLLIREENRAIVFNTRTNAATRELYNRLRSL